jgi:hypothetical protein
MKKIAIILLLLLISLIINIYSKEFFNREIIVEGVRNKNIYFGQSVNMESEVPLSYSNGIVLAFQLINRMGGINGYNLNLFVYNDNYDKEKAVKNAKILLEYDNVLGLIGTWGTPTSFAIYDKVIGQRNIPFIAPLTGSNLIRTDPNNVMMIRPSYIQEIDEILKHIVSNKLRNICVFYQNDEYGISCMNDLMNLYSTNDYPINIKSSSFERNSSYLYETFSKILDNNEPLVNSFERNSIIDNIDAILLFGTSKQEFYIINYFKKIKPNMFFYNISFVGENIKNLKKLKNKSNIYITNVLRVDETYHPILYKNLINEIEYNKSINPYLKTPIIMTQNLIEGFIAGLFASKIIEKINGKHINRENFINQLYNKKENYINVFDLKLGPFSSNTESTGLHKVYLLRFNGDTNTYEYIS